MATDNEMTVLELSDAENVAASDLLYLIQGDGATRDRKLTLDQLITFLQYKFSNLVLRGNDNSAALGLTPNGLTISDSGFTLGISKSGISITDSSEGVTVAISESGIRYSVNGGDSVTLSYDGGLVISNSAGTIKTSVEKNLVQVVNTASSNGTASVMSPDSVFTKKLNLGSCTLKVNESDSSSIDILDADGVQVATIGNTNTFDGASFISLSARLLSVDTFSTSKSATFNNDVTVNGNLKCSSSMTCESTITAGNTVTAPMFRSTGGIRASGDVSVGGALIKSIYTATAIPLASAITESPKAGAMVIVKNGTGSDVTLQNGTILKDGMGMLLVGDGTDWIQVM